MILKEAEKILRSLKVGDTCYLAINDSPVDKPSILECKVFEVCNDHLMVQNDGINYWADYDDEDSSCRLFKESISAYLFLGVEKDTELMLGGIQPFNRKEC